MAHSPIKKRREAAKKILKRYGYYPLHEVVEALYNRTFDYQELPARKSFIQLGKFFQSALPETRLAAYWIAKTMKRKVAPKVDYSPYMPQKKRYELNNYNPTFGETSSIIHMAKMWEDVRDLWVNDLEDFELNEKETPLGFDAFKALIHFVFAKYSVPDFLCRRTDVQYYFHFRLFVHIGQGGNVRRMQQFPYPLSKRAAHYFLLAPATANVESAFRFAQIRALGAERKLAWELANIVINLIVTEALVQQIIAFIIHHFPKGHEALNELIRYILYKKKTDATFSFKGRTQETIIQDMIDFCAYAYADVTDETMNFYAIRRLMSVLPLERVLSVEFAQKNMWTLIRVDDFCMYEKDVYYEIRQLRNKKELREEGQRMNHCVGGYFNECMNGKCSIWSLTKKQDNEPSKRLLTLELVNGRIVQAKGHSNRCKLSKEELMILEKWRKKAIVYMRLNEANEVV